MSFEAAIARPPRCVLVTRTVRSPACWTEYSEDHGAEGGVHVSSGESMECLFNPTQLSEKLQVNWNRLAVPGLSHQVLQFQNTANRQLSGIEFYLDRFFAAEQPGDANILEFRAFLRALTVPPGGTEEVASTAPPRVLFIWPGVLTIECVVASVEFSYKQLAVDGTVLVYSASVTFEEIFDTRVTSEELRAEL